MNLLWLLAIAVGANLAGFLVAYKLRSDKLTDFSYGATFLMLAVIVFAANSHGVCKWLALAMVALWSVRLAGFLLLRILKTKKDRRFDGVRESFLKFGQFWLFQGITAWLILLPVLLIMNRQSQSIGWLSWLGLAIWAMGWTAETIADAQKFRFSQNPANKDEFIDTGLWSVSRHPNYFGEISCWVGVYLFALPFLAGWQKWVALVSPAYIAFLLIFVTGIPKLECYADQKWGSRKDYQKYKKDTPILVPWPKNR